MKVGESLEDRKYFCKEDISEERWFVRNSPCHIGFDATQKVFYSTFVGHRLESDSCLRNLERGHYLLMF
jgi:hypothetical protein